MALTGKLTKKLVENLGAGRHGDGGGLYLVVDPSGSRRWIVRVVVKGQRNAQGAPLRTDFGLGGADVVTLNQARERALEYRRMAKAGLNGGTTRVQGVPAWFGLMRVSMLDAGLGGGGCTNAPLYGSAGTAILGCGVKEK